MRSSISFHKSINFARRLYPLHIKRNQRFFASQLQWPVSKVRDEFVNYFVKNHEHINYKSSPCVPLNDPTLLFANAGMNQFKPIFIGTVDPTSPLAQMKRAVNSQKCIRAGGKHNDLEDVGKDTYHHTFFEMLGTWSFGDYFKKEAIDWAFDILVNKYKLNPDRLYASYFAGDEALGLPCDTEAREFWLKYLPADRVLPFDKKANFWEMGDTGPCGPCSEIHYDRIGNRHAGHLVNADDPDVIEIWNLVFIQYNRETSGKLTLLPNKHIDTGMGLERLTSILQDVRSNYDTDVFLPIFSKIQEKVGCAPYSGKVGKDDAAQNFHDTAYRVLADHLRTLTFAITDGAYPSNEGRGYVLRRILRRAIRYGMQTLKAKPGFFHDLIPIIPELYGNAFPELHSKTSEVVSIVKEEELSFVNLLEKGIKFFNESLITKEKQNQEKIITGEEAFFLYDTLGFPIDLTQLMAAEKGYAVDMIRFHELMKEQKEKSKAAHKLKKSMGIEPLQLQADDVSNLQKQSILITDDHFKYSVDANLSTKLKAIFLSSSGFQNHLQLEDFQQKNQNQSIGIILEKTNFYAESGGQIADTGRLLINGKRGQVILDVVDTQSYGGYVLHTCIPNDKNISSSLEFAVDADVECEVDMEKRNNIIPNHTMTHVLNYALRKVLGENIDQKGSLVSDEKLRFDFSYSRPITKNELKEIESVVNQIIQENHSVHYEYVPLQKAKEIYGLRAVFGEVYPDPVRVLSIGPNISDLISKPKEENWKNYSIEFCGGIHIQNTKEAESFTIIEESSTAKGIRRITALTKDLSKEINLLSSQLFQEYEQLEKRILDLKEQRTNQNSSSSSSLKSISSSSLVEIDQRINDFRQKLEKQQFSQIVVLEIRENLENLIKQFYSIRNAELQWMIKERVASMEKEIKEKESSKSIGIFRLDDLPNDNSKLMKLVVDEIAKTAPTLSFLVILPNQSTKKLVLTAQLSKNGGNYRSDLSAPTWIAEIGEGLAGRAGGKANFAQGSYQLPEELSARDYEELLVNLQQRAERSSAR